MIMLHDTENAKFQCFCFTNVNKMTKILFSELAEFTDNCQMANAGHPLLNTNFNTFHSHEAIWCNGYHYMLAVRGSTPGWGNI